MVWALAAWVDLIYLIYFSFLATLKNIKRFQNLTLAAWGLDFFIYLLYLI